MVCVREYYLQQLTTIRCRCASDGQRQPKFCARRRQTPIEIEVVGQYKAVLPALPVPNTGGLNPLEDFMEIVQQILNDV